MEQEHAEITTASSSAACGIPFAVGQNYLIYASGDGRDLGVDLCSRTRPIEQADEDLRVIGLGATPVDPHAPASEKSVNTISAQPRPATKGGCASCSIGTPGHDARVPGFAALACALWLARRATRRDQLPKI